MKIVICVVKKKPQLGVWFPSVRAESFEAGRKAERGRLERELKNHPFDIEGIEDKTWLEILAIVRGEK